MKKLFFALIVILYSLTSAHAQRVGVEIGEIAPDIELPDAKGNEVSLSSLTGMVVLVDFWASWCPPCMKEQPELVKLYKMYPDKFSIYGVSLDTKKNLWLGTIAKYKQPWIQVNNLNFWKSPVPENYKMEAVPFNVLIDANGIIIAKNVHGSALNELVKNAVAQ